MVTLLPVQDSPSVGLHPEAVHCCERCRKQIETATREMAAYAMVVHQLFGKRAAARAVEEWIEAVERVTTPLIDGYPNWRQVTVAAASKLSIRRIQARNTYEITGKKGDE